jgi:hypothetical protein
MNSSKLAVEFKTHIAGFNDERCSGREDIAETSKKIFSGGSAQDKNYVE